MKEAKRLYADIIVDIALERLDRPFTYEVPASLQSVLKPGSVVTVPFGRGSGTRKGYVIAFKDKADLPEEKIKEILGVAEDTDGPGAASIELAAWMQETCGGTLVAALRTVLASSRKGRPVVKKEIELLATAEEAAEKAAFYEKKHQTARLRLLQGLLEVPRQPYEFATGKLHISAQTIRAMEKDGVIAVREKQILRNPVKVSGSPALRHPLSDAQRAVVDGVFSDFMAGRGGVNLLHGITGSGKTEVYLSLIEKIVAEGFQAIVLIPEIALTYQTLLRFYSAFGDRVSVINSGLTDAERADQYERARSGGLDVIIGPRSALFTPFPRTGIIVIDEEHEGTYKNESMPKYHAREVAAHIAETASPRAVVLLGSATPSLEAYSRAKSGEYRLYELHERLTGGSLPNVRIRDLREELRAGNRSILSRDLRELITDRLERGEQIMLFLNRRGYSGFVSCRSCGFVAKCPHCDVSLSYHALRGRPSWEENAGRQGGAASTKMRPAGKLVCHYCGYERFEFTKCPECGSPYIAGFKAGTQQIEKYLLQEFPGARILRMDADTTKTKGSYEKILSAFGQEEADILIGTQMIVKGHDFPKVTLVGILLADISLYSEDYRAAERTFQLLTQAAGRAGRGVRPGEVVIQTYQPEHYAVQLAARQDYEAFYEEEIRYRTLLLYPPAAHMLCVQIQSKTEDHALGAAGQIRAALDEMRLALREEGEKLILIGPSAARMSRLRDVYRYVLYIKSPEYDKLIDCRNRIEALQLPWRDVGIQYDHDPVHGF